MRTIGIMGAMTEEIDGILTLLHGREEIHMGKRVYHVGHINGIKTIVVFSRWGKVAAATTISTLILRFEITELIFTGVAGAINHDVRIGDVIIGKSLVQHDMDARPLYGRFEIPLLNVKHFMADETKVNLAHRALEKLIGTSQFSNTVDVAELDKFRIHSPRVYIGEIASGDKFFASRADKEELRKVLPKVLCVEMEGAAVAQVCYEYGIPFTVIRVISDDSDETAEINFPEFIKEVSSKYSVAIIRNLYEV